MFAIRKTNSYIMNSETTINDMYLKKLSYLNTQLLKTDNFIFSRNLNIHNLTIRQRHLFKSKEIIKSKIMPTQPKKKTLYESKLSASKNIRLEIVRKQSDTVVYCKGIDKQGKPKNDFDGYYFISELTKILNP